MTYCQNISNIFYNLLTWDKRRNCVWFEELAYGKAVHPAYDSG